MFRIHKEGKSLLGFSLVILVLIKLTFSFFELNEQFQNIALIISVCVYVLILLYYRKPKRLLAIDNQKVVAPVDGEIIGIQEIDEQIYFKEKKLQISIYSSPLSSRGSYFPISGRVKYARKHPGAFLFAWHKKAGSLNEQTVVVIENENSQEIMYRQIAGALGRNYAVYTKEGMNVLQGIKGGFNGFASRLDLILPLDSNLLVKIGDKTKGGQQILAELK
tara:strand:+ start:238 stop:897 length:660 start_codon:yes stop_codon:yes gene_type:complete